MQSESRKQNWKRIMCYVIKVEAVQQIKEIEI